MLKAHPTGAPLLCPKQARLQDAISASILHSLSKATTNLQHPTWSDQICSTIDAPFQEPMRQTETPDVLAVQRPPKPRIFKQQRQRRREDTPPVEKCGRMEEFMMVGPEDAVDAEGAVYLDRTTLCFPSFEEETFVHGGDHGYQPVLQRYFPAAESNATERLVALKTRLKSASTYDFWQILLKEMCDVFSAQCGFVSKRILVDVHSGPVEMPALGDPGSCMMGVAFYINTEEVKQLHRDYRYTAYGTPCAHMRHDKVFIIPERMSEVITDNPNAATMPWEESEAFIGVPLFADGKCFAHFGMIWSTEGAAKLNLSWSYVEMFLHSLEDMITERIVDGRSFVKESADLNVAKVVPLAAITPAQSLQPYARNLSHELRTPMQGVVGMLDIMYSTVLDAIANQPNDHTRSVFGDLKGHIELVQESSRRAVDAADNVVHAYDMNMQMPDAPLTPEDASFNTPSREHNAPLVYDPTPDERNIQSPGKRAYVSEETQEGPPLKKSFQITTEAEDFRIFHSRGTVEDMPTTVVSFTNELVPDEIDNTRLPSPALVSTSLHPLQQRVVTRGFLRSLVIDILRNSRPTRLEHTQTEMGERIEVQTMGSRDEVQDRVILLHVDPDVPEVVLTDPQPLQFSLQKIIDNAIKFTESGSISVRVRVGNNDDKVEFWIADTGCGIDEDAKQRLFKPHFQQDASISRSRDGMGLSLFNAKAHVRKSLGGDITLERSATAGPGKGSEFLIRLPMSRNASSDKTVVGTPPSSSHSSHRSFFPDTRQSPRMHARSPLLEGSISNVQGSHSPVLSKLSATAPKSTARKRLNFNPQLAGEFPLNILIAEDNAINRKVAVGSLMKLGYPKESITVAFDGCEAVEYFQKSLEQPSLRHFDVVLMDIWMPNMDGYESTTKIKQIAADAGVSITTVAVTADITSESRDRAKAIGMDGFLSKPYKVVDFEKLIIEHFSKMDVDR